MSEELAISKQGQIADRYDKALEKLSDSSANIRRGAIFSMQGIMEDSPREQPAVIDALSGYIRARATKNLSAEQAPDIQAAISALGHRNPSRDGKGTINLKGMRLSDADLRGVDLSEANLSGAVLPDCNLNGANLSGANLGKAVLKRADLTGANLTGANLAGADLTEASLDAAHLDGADLTGVRRPEADLSTPAPSRDPSPSAGSRSAQE
ncbi:pentapeptide repeat-containing protein [Streptomyces sp. L-9-10]|uniref:pentapeptide repeat-containing protein n=1 Tax=unclassified Streptomyces TaxID=2593676 RepID=UPI0013E9A0A4|nr:pentapeptide repeat-containing protein [Streptomyces sp. L-9-10]